MSEEQLYTRIWEQVKTLVDEDNLVIPEAAAARGWAVVPFAEINPVNFMFLIDAIASNLALKSYYAVMPEQNKAIELEARTSTLDDFPFNCFTCWYVLTTPDVQFVATSNSSDFLIIAGPREFVLTAIGTSILTARLNFVGLFSVLRLPQFWPNLHKKYLDLNGVLKATQDSSFVGQLLAHLKDVLLDNNPQLNIEACQARGWIVAEYDPPDGLLYYIESEGIIKALAEINCRVGYAIDLDNPQVYYRFDATLEEVLVITRQLDGANAIFTSADHTFLIRFYKRRAWVAGTEAFVKTIQSVYSPNIQP